MSDVKNLAWLSLCLVWLVVCPPLRAGITYRADDNAIWVKDYPEESPATLDTLHAADRQNRWGRVAWDRATDTYTIDASLWIGSDEDLGTFFQVGRKGHEKETLVLKGNLWVRPAKESIQRSDGRRSVVNRFTLGDPADASIRPALKIACATSRQFGVFIGLRTDDEWTHSGDLHAYNSIITAAVQDKAHILRGDGVWNNLRTGWYGSSIRLVNTTLSWIDGSMIYGAAATNAVLDGVTFEQGGRALQNGVQYAKNCVFRNLETAVSEGGCLSATLVNCRFEGNELNWSLGSAQSGGITMIDCEVGPPKKRLVIRKNQITPQDSVKRHVPIYPCYQEMKSVVLKVTDGRGRPVPAAVIEVGCNDMTAVRNPLTVTGADGLSPQDAEGDAILITVLRLQATDTPDVPKESRFAYTVKVRAQGYAQASVSLTDPAKVPRPMTIVLKEGK